MTLTFNSPLPLHLIALIISEHLISLALTTGEILVNLSYFIF